MQIELLEQTLAMEFQDVRIDPRPKRRVFQKMRRHLEGMTSENVMMLLNVVARCLSANETYLEVGCYRGCTACAAMSGIQNKNFIFIDNFTEFDPDGMNRNILLKNLKKHHGNNRYTFLEGDFRKIFTSVDFIKKAGKVGAYLYDGAHDYLSQKEGLMLAYDFLADKAIIMVDDINMDEARQADDELIVQGMFNLVYRFRTPQNGCKVGFWNGFDVLVKV